MEFSLTRVLSLLKRECILNGKVFLLLAVAVSALCAFIMFITTEEYCNGSHFIDITDILYISIILLGSTLFSNSIFTEFRQPTKRISYLSLPSSTFEKWLSKWILAFPVYLIISILIICITYFSVAYAIESTWSECRFIPLSNTFSKSFKFILLATLVYQSFAFILGILFNKYAVLKSIAVAAFISILFSLGMSILVKFTSISRTIETEAGIRILIFLVPFLWYISFVLLKRKQSDGV